MLKTLKKDNGITGVDIAISIIILLIFVSLIASLFSNINNINKKISRKTTAINIAIQALESIKMMDYDIIPEGEIPNDKVFTGDTSGSYKYSDNFPKGYKVIIISNSQAKYKEIIVSVTYMENSGNEKVEITTKIYDNT